MSLTSPLALLLLLATVLCHYSSCTAVLTSEHHPGYREVNWCITGMDEPELHEWPFSQFVNYIRRTTHVRLSNLVRYDLRFYDILTHQAEVGMDGRLFKTMHVVLKAEKRRSQTSSLKDIWDPMPIEGLIIQANANPYRIAIPTGQFFPAGGYDLIQNSDAYDSAEVHCTDCNPKMWARIIPCRKRAKIHPEHPTVLAWHHLQKSYNTSGIIANEHIPSDDDDNLPPAPPAINSDGKQTEVHANFRFYSPKCSPVRRMMFTVLVVRSFARHEYDLFYRGPYRVTVWGQQYQSDIHPSPYFLFYTQQAICHHHSALDITLEHPQTFRPFRMSHFFDCCIREEENYKSKVNIELMKLRNTLSVSCYEKLYKEHKGSFDPNTIKVGEESAVCFFPFLPSPTKCTQFEDADKYYEPCQPCRVPLSTTTLKPTEKPQSIYKRTVHGGLMIMTNFCLQPIVIYIARFYKETFNKSTLKGNKNWYWMHLMGGMVSSGMVYFGYFSGGVSDHPKVRDHVVIGDVYIITLAACYVTAWGRHKNEIVTTVAEFIHGCMGYVTISLALASIVSAPEMEYMSKLFVCMMAITQGFFMIILTCQIYLLDKKIGMRPSRRHFPTVEARFDELKVPGGKFRTIMLIIFSIITFTLSTASTFVQ